MYEINGEQYSDEDIKELAALEGLTFEEYLTQNSAKKLSLAPAIVMKEMSDKVRKEYGEEEQKVEQAKALETKENVQYVADNFELDDYQSINYFPLLKNQDALFQANDLSDLDDEGVMDYYKTEEGQNYLMNKLDYLELKVTYIAWHHSEVKTL